jgi:hypothetical protein
LAGIPFGGFPKPATKRFFLKKEGKTFYFLLTESAQTGGTSSPKSQ